MALAMEWVAKITTVGIEMVLPGIVGHYLDNWLKTSYLSICGFVLGLVIGLLQLIRWSQPPAKRDRNDKP
jgi:hypothetical protein